MKEGLSNKEINIWGRMFQGEEKRKSPKTRVGRITKGTCGAEAEGERECRRRGPMDGWGQAQRSLWGLGFYPGREGKLWRASSRGVR